MHKCISFILLLWNYYKLGDKTQKLIPSQFCSPESKIKVSARPRPTKGSQGELFLHLFKLLVDVEAPCLGTASLQVWACLHVTFLLFIWVPSPPLPFSCREKDLNGTPAIGFRSDTKYTYTYHFSK